MLQQDNQEILKHFIDVGRIFSSGRTFKDLFTDLMTKIRSITNAEGGSLYIYEPSSQVLKSIVLTNDVLNFHRVQETFDPLRIEGFIEIPMCDSHKRILLKSPLVYCFHKAEKIYIEDINQADSTFDFSNTRKFDAQHKYRTRNIMFLPLVGHNEKTIGVLQIVNCDPAFFSQTWQPFINALVGQVGVLLNNALLVSEARNLLSAMVSMIGVAIDEKSPHTLGHCKRVTALTMMIVDDLSKTKDGHYANFSVTDEERRELQIAAMLHDIGKIVTPLHIMEKPTKLFTLYDRINMLRERFYYFQQAEKVRRLEAKLQSMPGGEEIINQINNSIDVEWEGANDLNFLETINDGDIMIDELTKERLEGIAKKTIPYSNQKPLIEHEELDNLSIRRGTLNTEERKVMEDHVNVSIRLLSSIPWPHDLSRVVEYAGAHHERMDGRGYPNQLAGDQISLPARILCFADRFEAVSAPDRPYRKSKLKLSQVMKIMQKMSDEHEIDSDLFDFFKEKKIYQQYASQFIPAELIDYQ